MVSRRISGAESTKRSAMILLNGGAGSRGQMNHSCSEFLCSYYDLIEAFKILSGLKRVDREEPLTGRRILYQRARVEVNWQKKHRDITENIFRQ